MRLSAFAAFAFTALTALLPGVAGANPRAFPLTYTSETSPAGTAEVETYVDLTPLRVIDSSANRTWALVSQIQTELEYGLTDRLELGLYVTYVPNPGYMVVGSLGGGNGLKQRLRYVLATPGEWPVDVGLYGEVAENEHEIELEAKVILQRRFGQLRVATNLWAEYELYFSGEKALILAPTLAANFELCPSVQVGLETWMHAEYSSEEPTPRPFELGPHVYLGPTLLANFGKIWWSLGAYARVTDFGHTMQPGEPYGAIWVRSVIGVSL